ncbi:MAG TPA: sugar ABC transporter permease [Chloroflexia bacterium]|jgi:multiple sugar transport system permease protein
MATQAETVRVPKQSGMTRQRQEALTGYLFVSPWIISALVFTFGAMLYVFYLSFTDLQLLNEPKLIGIDNYVRVLGNKLFHTAVLNTVLYAVVVTFFQTWLALVLAVALNAKIRGKTFFRSAWYLPSVTSSVVISLIFVWVFQKEGILNFLLSTLAGWTGFQPVAWLTDASAHTALPALMLLNIMTTAPTFMLYFLAALQDIPEEVYEAASLDGSVGAHRFFRITVPMLRPIIFLVVVLGTIGTLQIFDQAFIMTNGGPLNQTTTINLLIYRSSFTDYSFAYASAMSIILFVMIVSLYLVQNRFLGGSNTER